MHYSLELLQKALSKPFGLLAKTTKVDPLPPVSWDCVKEPKSDVFTVGIAKADLTPGDIRDHKYYMAGYGIYKPVRGVLNPIYATALWLDDNSGHGGILLVSVDCVGIMNNDVGVIRQRLAAFSRITGCRAIHVMSTHCHASIDTMGFWGPLPRTGRDKKFFSLLFDGIETAAYEAYASRKDGDLFVGSAETEGLQQDKRLPVVFDSVLTRVRFAPRDGSQGFFALSYANHPEVLGSKNVMLSADYVHYLRKRVMKLSGAELIYFNGAIGGMITPTLDDGRESFDSMMAAGEKLADVVLSIQDERKLRPCVSIAHKEFYVPIENMVFALCGVLGVMPRDKFPITGTMLNVSMKTETNYLEIDDLHILMVPGELFPELAYGGYLEADVASSGGPEMNPVPLREQFGDPKLIIFGLANDELGYIIPPNDFLLDEKFPFFVKTYDHGGRRHYEEINSTGPRAAHILAENAQAILDAVKGA